MKEWIQKLWYIYIMKYYSAIKNNEFMKFLGMVGTEKYHPKWGNPITKECPWNATTDKWILISPETLNYQDTVSISNDTQEEKEGPGSEKSWSSIIGEYQDREMGGGDWEMSRGKRAHETNG